MKRFPFCTVLFLLTMHAYNLDAQSNDRPLNVGIFIYPGVEILDFTGPSEVFAATQGFNTFTVAFKKEPLLSQGFITVTPQYSIEDCPSTDILLFPGGGTGSVSEEPRMIEWIKQRSATTQFMVSVCTGAGLLSKAGLLDGLEVTTWHGFVPGLQTLTPSARVLTNTRFVDNGHIITTAGVSAGIDGALHIVSRIKGESAAKATAHYMEYDKWQPQAGKVHETPFVKTLREEGLAAAQKKNPPVAGSLQPRCYSGEIINLAEELATTDLKKAEEILSWAAGSLELNLSLYDALGKVYSKKGKYCPPNSHDFQERLSKGEVAWAREVYQTTLKQYPDWKFFTENDLNGTGYQLISSQKTEEALDVLKWNTELFPQSANAWDSYAETCELMGKSELAIAASEKCLALVNNGKYEEGLKKALEKASNDRLARLRR
ncbi:MAG: DJ-1/PfpI family protein [Saprospiraceae bacterium]|nr:DJ-1/PfpI family protein [Saprospiraceae bacterium]